MWRFEFHCPAPVVGTDYSLMKQFLIEFQKIRDIYDKVASQKSGMICVRLFGSIAIRGRRDWQKSSSRSGQKAAVQAGSATTSMQ
jgi:hypothetical protein